MKVKTHSEAAEIFIADEARTDWHNETLWFVRQKRDKAAHGIPEWEAPSHNVLPAIHLKKEDVSNTFHEQLQTEKGNIDPTYLTRMARVHLRQYFFDSEVALTGVNEVIDISNVGYGVFIAGPSKTADIEQSLIIGAHGPIKCSVFLLIEESKTNTNV